MNSQKFITICFADRYKFYTFATKFNNIFHDEKKNPTHLWCNCHCDSRT